MDRIEKPKSECDKLSFYPAITETHKAEKQARLNANREELKRLAILLEVDCV